MPKITNLSVRGDSPQPESSSVKEEIQVLSLSLDFSKYEVKRYFGGGKASVTKRIFSFKEHYNFYKEHYNLCKSRNMCT